MLQSLRDNLKGAVAVFIIALMVVPLVLFGVDSLFVNNGSQIEAATVNGEEISELDLQRAVAFRKNQLQSQLGDNLPADFISDENLRAPVLTSLIKREVLAQAAKEGGMGVSTQRVYDLIAGAPEFQVNGEFSQDQFRYMVNNLGYTQQGYIDQVSEDLMLNQQVSGIASSGFVTSAEYELIAGLSSQQRDFYYLTVPLAPIQAAIVIGDDEATAYYEEHKSEYMNPEQVSIEYLELSLAQIAATMQVSDEELKAQYDEEVKAFSAQTERHVAHILIESKGDGSEQATLDEIEKKLADGGDFAALASEYSTDFGTKELGGDLGYIADGEEVEFPPAQFKDALAKLNVGEVSAPVKTEFGFHIIKLLDVQGATPPTFEEDKNRIANTMKTAAAEDRFLDLQRQMDDVTYNAKDLAEAGKTLGLIAKNAGPFSRNGGFGIASNPQVVEAAYNDDTLKEGNTSPLITLEPNHVLVLRVTDHQEPRILNYDEVHNDIVSQLKRTKAVEQLVLVGADIQEKVKAGESIEDLAKANDYEWQVSINTKRSQQGIRREILNHVFALPRPGNSSIVSGINTTDGNYAVVDLTKVADGNVDTLSPAERDGLKNRLASLWGEASYVGYEELLKSQAKIKIQE